MYFQDVSISDLHIAYWRPNIKLSICTCLIKRTSLLSVVAAAAVPEAPAAVEMEVTDGVDDDAVTKTLALKLAGSALTFICAPPAAAAPMG